MKTIIILIVICLIGCVSISESGFNKMDYPVNMTVSEYNVLLPSEKISFCYGYLVGLSIDTGSEILTNPVNAVELKSKIKSIIKHDTRVQPDTLIFFIAREAIIQILTAKQKQSA